METRVTLAKYMRCFNADTPPTCIAREIIDHRTAEHPSVVIELQDIIKAMMEEQTLDKPSSDTGIVRYTLGLKDARALCCHLISRLAAGGDRIAERLDPLIPEILEELKNED